MENLGKLFWKVLAEKKIWQVSKWAMINSISSNFLSKICWIEKIEGKIEFNKYIIKANSSVEKHCIFLNKKKLLDQINKQLELMNYDKINDIKVI